MRSLNLKGTLAREQQLKAGQHSKSTKGMRAAMLWTSDAGVSFSLGVTGRRRNPTRRDDGSHSDSSLASFVNRPPMKD